ncbi:MAG: DUF4097 family beta strand repeat-containing protein [Rhodothermales bacterium]|nr:DUF4097 family beta strand repeat-containing protein [Rhodothermales bacterium]
MKTTITAVLLCVLGALGLLNIGQSLKNHLFPCDEEAETTYTVQVATSTDEEVMLDERFKVSAGDVLDLSLSHADVDIQTTDRMEAHIRVSVSATSEEKAREYFESRNFEVRQDGDRVIVKMNPRKRNWNWNSGRVDMNVEVSIPTQFNAEIAMSHGDLEMGELEGYLDLKNSHGDVEVAAVRGDWVDIKLSHGDVELGRAMAEKVKLHNSHGDLEVGEIATKMLNATNSHGDLSVGIKEGGTMELTNSHGAVDIAMSSAVGGSIRNSHGDIDIETHGDAAMTLDFQGSTVRLDESLSFQGTSPSQRVEGAVNGGGPLLKARTSHGSIRIG